jgi:hypothetical protein
VLEDVLELLEQPELEQLELELELVLQVVVLLYEQVVLLYGQVVVTLEVVLPNSLVTSLS